MQVRELVGTADELHHEPMPTEGGAALWLMRPTQPAVVMGSSQKAEAFLHERLAADGVALGGRRSGGGAVFIDPAETVWIDVLAPRSSADDSVAIWSDDLGETFLNVGRRWQAALESLGVDTTLCSTAPARSDAARIACWAGVGWGEVLVGEHKVVGLSQRRTRWGARVQAVAVIGASAWRVTDYLIAEQAQVVRQTMSGTPPRLLQSAGVGVEALEAAVVEQFVVHQS